MVPIGLHEVESADVGPQGIVYFFFFGDTSWWFQLGKILTWVQKSYSEVIFMALHSTWTSLSICKHTCSLESYTNPPVLLVMYDQGDLKLGAKVGRFGVVLVQTFLKCSIVFLVILRVEHGKPLQQAMK